MRPLPRLSFCLALLAAMLPAAILPAARAAEPFKYPEAKHGKGELKYIDGLPVLCVAGTPEEIGEQIGVLALKPAAAVPKLAEEFFKANQWEIFYALTVKTGGAMLEQMPTAQKQELAAATKASGWPRDLLVFANTVADIRKIAGCSTLFVEGTRSATGGPLFGRNFDWPPFGAIDEYTLVTVYRPKGKRAFVSVGYPGVLGCVSGMNDAGLALADLTVRSSRDESPALDPTGMPSTFALRRVMEECASVEDAEKILKSLKRSIMQNVAIGDKQRAVVFEITTKTIVTRPATDGLCLCTNHFRSEELSTWKECERYATLEKSRDLKQFSVADVAQQMDAVSQGSRTLQTMVFEPATLTLHVAFGKGPATKLPLKTLECGKLFLQN